LLLLDLQLRLGLARLGSEAVREDLCVVVRDGLRSKQLLADLLLLEFCLRLFLGSDLLLRFVLLWVGEFTGYVLHVSLRIPNVTGSSDLGLLFIILVLGSSLGWHDWRARLLLGCWLHLWLVWDLLNLNEVTRSL
jgi:hypothetical protein